MAVPYSPPSPDPTDPRTPFNLHDDPPRAPTVFPVRRLSLSDNGPAYMSTSSGSSGGTGSGNGNGNGNGSGHYSAAPSSSSRVPSRFVSSPLNPNVASARSSRPGSWGSSYYQDRDRQQGQTPSSDGSSGEPETSAIRGILSGDIGRGLGPYANVGRPVSMPAADAHFVPTPPHARFSTVSSVGSVLSFASDSKYAYTPGTPVSMHANFLPYVPHDADPRASMFQAYDHYERMGEGPPEDDDELHEPDAKDRKDPIAGASVRGVMSVSALVVILTALITLFLGYPIIDHFARDHSRDKVGLGNLVNSTGQIPDVTNDVVLASQALLIDPDTPSESHSRTGFDGKQYDLVFSDEFNKDGRSFRTGDDPFWEAVNASYSSSLLYDPAQVTTKAGHLAISAEKYGSKYKSAMLQSWNKLCFTTGYIELAVSLPGSSSSTGLEPRAWLLGNLARAGYPATTEGTSLYSYNTCDASAAAGSSLKGQKLSACTCPGEDHPGPSPAQGRGAPQINVFDGHAATHGAVAQSALFAPYSAGSNYSASAVEITDSTKTSLSALKGSTAAQVLSAETTVDPSVYTGSGGSAFGVFGFEYWSDPAAPADGYISWIAGGEKVFTVRAPAVGADPASGVGQRLISEEPMSIVLNLALSETFQTDATSLPAQLLIDYVRVYQRTGSTNLGCSTSSYPTADYIEKHSNAYTDPTYTSWSSAGYAFPKSSLGGGC